MSGINSVPPPTVRQSQVTGQGKVNNTFPPVRIAETVQSEQMSDAGNHISSFSQALSDVATRAGERDANTSRYELSKIARATIEKLFGEVYQKNKAIDDAEVPSSDDPQRLVQAQQATDYTHGKGHNPFKDMPSDQLALIIYDESGTFTTNERRAAYDESYSQHIAWKTAICAKAMDDYHRDRKISSGLYQEVLDHYRALPPIEESQLLEGYEADFQNLIDQNGSDSTPNSDKLESIFDLIMEHLNQRQNKQETLSGQPAPTLKNKDTSNNFT